MKTHKDGTLPFSSDYIFVFGSNLSGFHGGGAAKKALDSYGAFWGVADGLVGNSYAIPTKGYAIDYIKLSVILPYIAKFVRFAKEHKDMKFFLTRIGCGLAGFRDCDIAPLFRGIGDNCDIPEEWEQYLFLRS